MPKGLFTQLSMIVVAAAIIFTYVRPAFVEVGKIQDDIGLYQEERQKVLSVNSRLSSLVSQMDSVSVEDRRRLLTYMPDTVDDLSVSRDLLLITRQAGVLYKDVGYSGPGKGSKNTSSGASVLPEPQQFTLSVEGTYTQIKNLFTLLEQNHYPLEIHGVSIGKADGGFLTVEIELMTYSFNSDIDNQAAL